MDSVAVDSTTRVYLSNRDGLVMPVTVAVEFRDGTSLRKLLPAHIWATGDFYTLEPPEPTRVARVTVDPDGWLPDVRRHHDVWPRDAVSGAARSAP